MRSVALLCLWALGCGDVAEDEPDHSPVGLDTIVTVGGDYMGAGILSTVNVATLEVRINAVAGVVGGDPVLRTFGEHLYILDRFGGDSITVLDRQLRLVGQSTTGAGSNPQDVAVVGDRIYVAALGTAGVLVFAADDISGGVVDTIDLSQLDPDDGIPDCNSLYAVGRRLFVACQISERPLFVPRSNGKIAVIDTANGNRVTDVLELSSKNPATWLTPLPNGDLMLGTAPTLNGNLENGCVYRIETSVPAAVTSECLIDNREQGGWASALMSVREDLYFVHVVDSVTTEVRIFDGAVVSAAELPGAGRHNVGLALCPSGQLVLTDNRDGAKGIHIYDQGELRNPAILEVGWPAQFYPVNSTICW